MLFIGLIFLRGKVNDGDYMKNSVDYILYRLSKSRFRSSFHLNKSMKSYVSDRGIDTIEKHAFDFINSRLKDKEPKNDGKQTPMKGHPVFIAQHACACCCRGCLYKWYRIPKGRELSDDEVKFIVSILIKWIEKECGGA